MRWSPVLLGLLFGLIHLKLTRGARWPSTSNLHNKKYERLSPHRPLSARPPEPRPPDAPGERGHPEALLLLRGGADSRHGRLAGRYRPVRGQDDLATPHLGGRAGGRRAAAARAGAEVSQPPDGGRRRRPACSPFEAARHAPLPVMYLAALQRVLVPALHRTYREYLAAADELGDGPTRRFLELAVREKERQIEELAAMVELLLSAAPESRPAADDWAGAVASRMEALGGVTLEAVPPLQQEPLPGSAPFALAQVPGRDPRFHRCRFYWPDAIDPSYPYGEGIALQLRSAISHLNEVWAVDTAGAILEAFAGTLGWEFVSDAARWVYDESRHTVMGWTRLRDWGFSRDELPLGTYIYDAARDQDPIYRLGMLFFFETKNIGKKTGRAAAFASYGDAASQHDMEFDWADEGIHAAYGKRWLTALIAARGLPSETFEAVQRRCEELVAATVASATADEAREIRRVADHLIARASALAVPVS